jgi:D-alanyl-D-alanine dipeptidase
MPLVTVIALIILVSLYIVLWEKDVAFRDNPIGKRQFDLHKIYSKAESPLFYIDQSAKYALQQSVYELAQNGGFSEIDVEDIDTSGEAVEIEASGCGKFNGADVWYILKKTQGGYIETSCFDENSVNMNLEYLFNKNLNLYLEKHPENIPINNYAYEIRDNLEIIGRALYPLKFDILKEELKTKEITKEPIQTPEGLVDFTGTELCKKGSRCLLTKEAYLLLEEAQKKATEKGVSLEVTEGYRSLEEQAIIWNRNPDKIFVCPPSPKCPHFSGNAVDTRFKGKTLYTMTSADWRLLHNIMSEAGWVRYGVEDESKIKEVGEPWHFECCGTPRDVRAKAQGVDAIV